MDFAGLRKHGLLFCKLDAVRWNKKDLKKGVYFLIEKVFYLIKIFMLENITFV
ncbi:hypothetical protein JOC77_001574 [Peribacillus deserti]|uniref:Uncharacterized protein n=1 Tax=Peribacillus deserti TaxID=673318 RepID=A0ABS2QG66_9BACI|nr:hypothetical protein [Peribacillus deserti]